jgi:hypothetical protein
MPDMNMLLHESRGAMLREIPRNADVFLSAGCSGSWYFKWIEECCGHIRRHIGLEYYMPRPDQLPANVEWIENTCSDMSDVSDGVCDVIFSGQNFEHLWPEELIGFFLESARVSKLNGLLVMDSPNRSITEALQTWSHPEHTVEATVEEAVELAELAGFSVTAVKGIWLDRDPATGGILPHAPTDAGTLSVTERILGAVPHPQDAFIWWVEARRNNSPPDAAALSRRVHQIFANAWPERVGRMTTGAAKLHHLKQGSWLSQIPTGFMSPILYGPYMPLPAGQYSCEFYLDSRPTGGTTALICDVVIGRLPTPLVSERVTLTGGRRTVKLQFTLDQLEFGLEFRCFSESGAPFLCYKHVDFKDLRRVRAIDLSVPLATPPRAFEAADYPWEA